MSNLLNKDSLLVARVKCATLWCAGMVALGGCGQGAIGEGVGGGGGDGGGDTGSPSDTNLSSDASLKSLMLSAGAGAQPARTSRHF